MKLIKIICLFLLVFVFLPRFVAGEERCAPGYAFDSAKRECIACNQPCETGKYGICGRGLVDCSTGVAVCLASIEPGERMEVCNGDDDNCDGRIDEDFDKDSDGYTTCSGDCDDHDMAIHPDAVERCDDRDNNCNGLIDDGFNIGGACTVGLGECRREGRRRCQDSGLGAMCDVAAGKPSPEICDSLDNDCDGAIDDGLGEVTCGVGACERKVPSCQSGAAPTCVAGDPSPEICGDHVDNDCNGTTDEGFAGLGRPCHDGIGACRRDGKLVCSEDGRSLICSAVAGEPVGEVCGNGIDDDCNGVVDTDVFGLGDPCDNGLLGACRREGRLICSAAGGKLECSAGAVEPSQEVCNGIDDDCDGSIDEGVTNACGGCGDLPGVLGAHCKIPGGDECATGVFACKESATGSDSGMECVLDAKRSEGTACASDGNSCTRDICRTGKCGHEPSADGIVCDDGNSCTEADFCMSGFCQGGALTTCDDANPCTADACDPERGCYHNAVGGGIVNACGGCEVLANSPGEACELADKAGICGEGAFVCQPDGQISCVQQMFASAESCNGLDDDCDGSIDNGLGSSTCGIGACQVTTKNCTGGQPQTCTPRDPLPETCSNMNADDDCNGIVDDIAGLGEDCPFAAGTCIIPGRKRCIGDAERPVCVAINPRDAEDEDGNDVVNYCDHGGTLVSQVEGELREGVERGPGGAGQSARLYDLSRTRAVMLPWRQVFDSVLMSPGIPEQAMLLVSGATGAEGGIAAIRTKDISSEGRIVFSSCTVPEAEAPRHLFVIGAIADVIGVAGRGYVRYPKIASQIPSPLVTNRACHLRGEPIPVGTRRDWSGAEGGKKCLVEEVAALKLTSERPLEFAGAVVCSFGRDSFWKRQTLGIGIDVIAEAQGGGIRHDFVPFADGVTKVGAVHLVPLTARQGGGIFIAADVDEGHLVGVCRNRNDGWRCTKREAGTVMAPIAFAGFLMEKGAPLLILTKDGLVFEVHIDLTKGTATIRTAGVAEEDGGGVVDGALAFPRQGDRPPLFLLARKDSITVASLRRDRAAASLVQPLAGEKLQPEATTDDVFSGGEFTFGRPHAMAHLPLKRYGGDDLFAVYEIMEGSKVIGEMAFVYWNANEGPTGSLSDIRFDGKHGTARLAFEDPTGDVLTYRASVRANHGGLLDNWVDGFEKGRFSFSVKGDASSVGLWPIHITVEASDPGGQSTVSRVVLGRDGTVESISDSSIPEGHP